MTPHEIQKKLDDIGDAVIAAPRSEMLRHLLYLMTFQARILADILQELRLARTLKK